MGRPVFKLPCHKCGTPPVAAIEAWGEVMKLVTLQGRKRPWGGIDRERTLAVRFVPRERDAEFWSPRRCDGHLVYNAFAGFITWPEFLYELDQRGYDLNTLRFSVEMSRPATAPDDEKQGRGEP